MPKSPSIWSQRRLRRLLQNIFTVHFMETIQWNTTVSQSVATGVWLWHWGFPWPGPQTSHSTRVWESISCNSSTMCRGGRKRRAGRESDGQILLKWTTPQGPANASHPACTRFSQHRSGFNQPPWGRSSDNIKYCTYTAVAGGLGERENKKIGCIHTRTHAHTYIHRHVLVRPKTHTEGF